MARGGKREGAGRPKNEPDENNIKIGKGFATRVLARIVELKLRYRLEGETPDAEPAYFDDDADDKPAKKLAAKAKDKNKPTEPGLILSAEDYCLDILRPRDAAARDMFKLLLAYQLGKPVQPTITADTRETAPELDFGNLVMPDAPADSKAKSRASGKPN